LRKELIRLVSVEGQPTKAVLAQTFMGVFFIRSVSDTIFAMPFFSNTGHDHMAKGRGPQFEEHFASALMCLDLTIVVFLNRIFANS
jgi:hypothetical protein